MSQKHILISNDDGVDAPGIRALTETLRGFARVTVIAPLTEQSASSHALTLHHPLRVKKLSSDPETYAVQGTPTDCVLLAVREFLDAPPDLVVSGINQGPNLGEDVLYSGTVAAAMEGALLGIRSVALSLASWKHRDFAAASRVAGIVARRLLEGDGPQKLLLNVNIPPMPEEQLRGFRMTQLGSRVYNDAIIKKEDPRGREYYWIGGSAPSWRPTENSDFQAVEEGFVSVTPLRLDLTAPESLEYLGTWGLTL